ncbi:MAG: hypothetical protein GY769_07030, partial [bacterium]|nr:hypothetical protein [bacterium]
TDSEGKTQTRTKHRYNSGGSRGPSGRSGRAGQARVHSGEEGARGSFAIEVASKTGVQTYNSRYDLRLVDFAHESGNRDCVYEPQETVRVFAIEVENSGGMPTPKHRDIELSLVRDRWVAPVDDERLLLPRGLAAGERCQLEEKTLHLVIGDYRPSGPDDPLEVEETIRQRAHLPAVFRDFAAYENEDSRARGKFLIRFPVRAEPIRSLY